MGLGNVGQYVREIIERVRVRVDAAVNKLVEYVAQQGNSWLATAGGCQSPVPANRRTGQPPNQGPPPATRQKSDGGLPPTHVTYGTNGGKAGWVLAEPLTKLPGNTKGTRPHEDIPGWSYIGKMPRQEKILWEKVHLLSEQLHGPGESWNLVPARKIDNAWMRQGPEQTAKDLVKRNEILYYHVSVAYHTGTEDESNFPSNITVTFGHLERQANGGYKKRQYGQPLSRDLDKPPSIETARVYDLNGIGERTMRDLGIDLRVARNILAENKNNGNFTSASDFLRRMNAFYNNKRDRNPNQRSNFEADHWSTIQELINNNRLRIGSPD